MRDRRNDIAKAAINTCTWLSGDPKYLEWLNSRHGLLWVKGHPGVGKSTLMKYASKPERSPENGICASFFFYGGGTRLQKSPLGLFRSLLHQIVEQVPSLLLELTHIFKIRCETDGIFEVKWNWHERELQEFFDSAVVEVAKTEVIRVYVDALDECGEQAATSLVTFFQGLAESLSICFSCRHYPLLALEYGLEICVENENSQDIQTYVNHALNKEHYDSIRDQIIKKSAGNFLWVKLVAELVLNLERKGIPRREIQRKIHQIPQELSRLYEDIFTKMAQDNMQDSLRLMRWIYFGLRPLSLRELRTAMAVDACSSSRSVDHYQQTGCYVETDEAMERRVCDLSRGLAGAVQHGERRIVQFFHQSVIDFLVDEGFQLLDRSQTTATVDTFAGRSHIRLLEVCIRCLVMVTLPPPLLSDPFKYKSDLDLEFLFLGYATVFWIHHAEECEKENLSAIRLVSYFDSSSLLHSWLSLIKLFEPLKAGLSWPITVAHVASRYNLVHVLGSILSQSANVNLKDGRGRTPLSIAAERGSEKIVQLLLQRNDVEADSRAHDHDRSPLSYAAELGHEKIVDLFLKRNDIKADSRNRSNQSPLLFAAAQGHEKIVGLLLKRNDVQADSKDSYNRTPLSHAAKRGRKNIVELLLKRNDAEMNSKDIPWGMTPLAEASEQGHKAIVELLLERDDVVVDSVDNQGRTSLSWASEMGHEIIVRLLIERGNADVNSKDPMGRTPLWYAKRSGRNGIVKLLEQHRCQEESGSFRENKRRTL